MGNKMGWLGFIAVLFPSLLLAAGVLQHVSQTETALQLLMNPNVVYLLLLVGIYGLFFEIAHPGLILPGVLGMVALLLVVYAFQLIPINYFGLVLLAFSLLLMLFEVYVFSFGIMGILGVGIFLFGSFLLFNTPDSKENLSWLLILTMSLLTLGFFFMLAFLVMQSRKKTIVTGKEGLIGREAEVLSVIHHQVVVRVLGEIWQAKSKSPVHPHQQVRVINIEGLVLEVEPLTVAQPKKSGEI